MVYNIILYYISLDAEQNTVLGSHEINKLLGFYYVINVWDFCVLKKRMF